jgi:hypothetical protein
MYALVTRWGWFLLRGGVLVGVGGVKVKLCRWKKIMCAKNCLLESTFVYLSELQ